MPILKPLISLTLAGAVAISAYAHLDADQQGKIASIEKTVVDGIGTGITWLSGTVGTVVALIPYRLPEIQPNGDIVIKRQSQEAKSPAKVVPADEPRIIGEPATNI